MILEESKELKALKRQRNTTQVLLWEDGCNSHAISKYLFSRILLIYAHLEKLVDVITNITWG